MEVMEWGRSTCWGYLESGTCPEVCCIKDHPTIKMWWRAGGCAVERQSRSGRCIVSDGPIGAVRSELRSLARDDGLPAIGRRLDGTRWEDTPDVSFERLVDQGFELEHFRGKAMAHLLRRLRRAMKKHYDDDENVDEKFYFRMDDYDNSDPDFDDDDSNDAAMTDLDGLDWSDSAASEDEDQGDEDDDDEDGDLY